VSVRESAGDASWEMGRRTDGREDESLSVVEAGSGWEVRVCGVDAGRAFEAFAVSGVTQE
jgi:hypothetical protein